MQKYSWAVWRLRPIHRMEPATGRSPFSPDVRGRSKGSFDAVADHPYSFPIYQQADAWMLIHLPADASPDSGKQRWRLQTDLVDGIRRTDVRCRSSNARSSRPGRRRRIRLGAAVQLGRASVRIRLAVQFLRQLWRLWHLQRRWNADHGRSGVLDSGGDVSRLSDIKQNNGVP